MVSRGRLSSPLVFESYFPKHPLRRIFIIHSHGMLSSMAFCSLKLSCSSFKKISIFPEIMCFVSFKSLVS